MKTEYLKTLVVDDNKDFRNELAKFINNQYGFKVVGNAKDGKEAINLVSVLKPDVVTLDVSMPKLDGLTVAEMIRKKYPDIFVIIITIHDEQVFKEIAGALPVFSFICKSSVSEELPKVLARLKSKRIRLREKQAGTKFIK